MSELHEDKIMLWQVFCSLGDSRKPEGKQWQSQGNPKGRQSKLTQAKSQEFVLEDVSPKSILVGNHRILFQGRKIAVGEKLATGQFVTCAIIF